VSDCIIYILYYILAYFQHNGDFSLENCVRTCFLSNSSLFCFHLQLINYHWRKEKCQPSTFKVSVITG